VEDQEFSQKARELILQYQSEDYQFPGRAAKEIDAIEVRGDDLRPQAAVCKRLSEEIEETRKKREAEVEELCQGNFERKVKLLREVRELNTRARFTVGMIVRRREKGREFKRAGSDTFEQGKVYKQIEEGDKLIQNQMKTAIKRMNDELDLQVEEKKKKKERKQRRKNKALQHRVEALEAAMQGMKLRGEGRKVEVLPLSEEEVEEVAGKAKKSKDSEEAFHYTADYTSVNLRGQQFTLTPRQAEVIQLLHEAYKNGTPDLHHEHIKERLRMGNSAQVRGIFRSNPDAWKYLVTQGKRKGTLRLNI
jgi:hypothetical protein